MLVRQIFSLWWEPLPMGLTSEEIMQLADALIAQFWKESSDSLRFAPSTIAISALLLAFSKCKMNCSAWLQRLPDEILPSKNPSSSPTSHPIFVHHEISFFDIDACLLAMTKEERTSCSSSKHHPDHTYLTPPPSPETDTTTMNTNTTIRPHKHRRVGTPTTVITSFSDEMLSS